jgi:hypothetical protein
MVNPSLMLHSPSAPPTDRTHTAAAMWGFYNAEDQLRRVALVTGGTSASASRSAGRCARSRWVHWRNAWRAARACGGACIRAAHARTHTLARPQCAVYMAVPDLSTAGRAVELIKQEIPWAKVGARVRDCIACMPHRAQCSLLALSRPVSESPVAITMHRLPAANPPPSPRPQITPMYCSLDYQESIHTFVAEFLALGHPLHLLVRIARRPC